MSRWSWMLSQLSARLWVRATLYGVVAVVTALAAIYLKRFIPEDLPQKIGADAVDGILNIMAASMLSVTIFSLSTMVSAYGAATSNVTPRATKLLIEDKVSQRALSTFSGAFIFSIVGIIALKTGAYGEAGRLILFMVTIAVIVMIIVTLLRWIEYLSRLGRVNETIERVEAATTQALQERLRDPYLGGHPLLHDKDIPPACVPVWAGAVGYVQYVDMGHLSRLADEHEITLYLQAPPGKFVDAYFPLVMVAGTADENILAHIRKAFILGDERSFTQDPRYGVAVMCEIGTRALSSAINDTGTPIYVIGIAVRLFSIWAKRAELAGPDNTVKHPRIFVPALKIDDLFDDFFPALARDGAGILEVQIRLQKAYAALMRAGDDDLARCARNHAALSLKRAQMGMALSEDYEKLRALSATLLPGPGGSA